MPLSEWLDPWRTSGLSPLSLNIFRRYFQPDRMYQVEHHGFGDDLGKRKSTEFEHHISTAPDTGDPTYLLALYRQRSRRPLTSVHELFGTRVR